MTAPHFRAHRILHSYLNVKCWQLLNMQPKRLAIIYPGITRQKRTASTFTKTGHGQSPTKASSQSLGMSFFVIVNDNTRVTEIEQGLYRVPNHSFKADGFTAA